MPRDYGRDCRRDAVRAMVDASALIAPATNRAMHAALSTIATLRIRDSLHRSRHMGGLH